jgi:predicted Rdx family selenoprotein
VAAELKKSVGVDPKLVAGAGGVFEVTVDSNLIFSKQALHRFPEAGEVTKLIRGLGGVRL